MVISCLFSNRHIFGFFLDFQAHGVNLPQSAQFTYQLWGLQKVFIRFHCYFPRAYMGALERILLCGFWGEARGTGGAGGFTRQPSSQQRIRSSEIPPASCMPFIVSWSTPSILLSYFFFTSIPARMRERQNAFCSAVYGWKRAEQERRVFQGTSRHIRAFAHQK